jgi:hypothetical protein
MPEDFWPEINPGSVRTPVAVLREQAGLLGRKTRNLVVGDVRGGPVEEGYNSLWILPIGGSRREENREESEKKGFRYRLDLVAPALGDYRFTALTIAHGIELYPVSVRNHLVPEAIHPSRNEVRADSEDELKEALREILSSAEMKRVIETLIAQSQALSTAPV